MARSAWAGMITTSAAVRGGRASLHERWLLVAAQRDDRRAQEELVRRYQPLLRATVHRLRLPVGVDRDDIAQEARIGFLRAVKAWRPDRGTFGAFARSCVRNQVLHALDSAGAEKHKLLSHAVCLDAAPQSSRHGDPEAAVLAREQLAALALAMRALTDWERTALHASLNEIPHGHVARQHGATPRAVTLAARRGRRKLATRTQLTQPT
jgi:RNA polymerase sporulation-specific sigma factor